MKNSTIIITTIIILLLTSCMAHSHELSESVTSNVKGFWSGLWHGLISPIAFIISLFNDDISVYDANNNGGWYNFGYILGIGSTLGGGSKVTK